MSDNRQLTTPILLQDGKAVRLERIPLDERFNSEDWLRVGQSTKRPDTN